MKSRYLRTVCPEMPERTTSAENYRFGFNGKEKDPDISSLNHYDYGFRIYNPGIGRFLSVDPLTRSYPMLTPYQFASNRPIWAVDVDGLEAYVATEKFFEGQQNPVLSLEYDNSAPPLEQGYFYRKKELYNRDGVIYGGSSINEKFVDHPGLFTPRKNGRRDGRGDFTIDFRMALIQGVRSERLKTNTKWAGGFSRDLIVIDGFIGLGGNSDIQLDRFSDDNIERLAIGAYYKGYGLEYASDFERGVGHTGVTEMTASAPFFQNKFNSLGESSISAVMSSSMAFLLGYDFEFKLSLNTYDQSSIYSEFIAHEQRLQVQQDNTKVVATSSEFKLK